MFTIAGLTLTEAARRRTLHGAFLVGLLIVGISMLLIPIRSHMVQMVATGARDTSWLALEYPIVRSHIMTLCLFAIRVMASIFAVLLAGGAIARELALGSLA